MGIGKDYLDKKYSGKPVVRPASPPRIGMGMRLEIGGGGMEIQQRLEMRLSPPVANTLEEAETHALRKKVRKISLETLNALQGVLKTEDPSEQYSDAEIISKMKKKGYDINSSDILFARVYGIE